MGDHVHNGVQWESPDHRIVILKGHWGDSIPASRLLYSASYVILNDNGTFIIVKNRSGILGQVRQLLSDELQVEFSFDGDNLKLTHDEDLAILRLKGIL